jgi:GNAT superfamily N-acetyltransferase
MTVLGRDLDVREPAREDVPAMAALMVRGNSTYREWAPRFWQPPGVERTQAQWYLRLREVERWTRIATRDGELVAFASWRPAQGDGEQGPPLPGVGYVSHLYVDPERWAEGTGSGLLSLAESAMREAGCVRAILWTPERARARGFYERCGWRIDGRRRWSTELQLPMVRYGRDLRPPRGS